MIEFVERYGAPLVFAVVFIDQLGLPVPAVPLLLALGALAGRGSIATLPSLLAATAGSVGADLLWFHVGRRRGARVLGFLCRMSLEPDSCVSKTEGLFARHGVKSLLVAKFVPGFDTVAPPLAGMLGVGLVRFLLWTTAGALVWLLAFGGLGYAFSGRLEELAGAAARMGDVVAVGVAVLFAAWIGWKWHGRQRVLRGLRMARITPEELHRLIVEGAEPAIVDVREEIALAALPFTIPGARFITFEELDARHREIPREGDVILFCT